MRKLQLVAAGASLLVLQRVFRALAPALAKLIRDDRKKAKALLDRVSRELLEVKPDLGAIRGLIRKVEALVPASGKSASRKLARRRSASRRKTGSRKATARRSKSRKKAVRRR
jgi:hypothetical protein